MHDTLLGKKPGELATEFSLLLRISHAGHVLRWPIDCQMLADGLFPKGERRLPTVTLHDQRAIELSTILTFVFEDARNENQ